MSRLCREAHSARPESRAHTEASAAARTVVDRVSVIQFARVALRNQIVLQPLEHYDRQQHNWVLDPAVTARRAGSARQQRRRAEVRADRVLLRRARAVKVNQRFKRSNCQRLG